jgi:hypothetical protein
MLFTVSVGVFGLDWLTREHHMDHSVTALPSAGPHPCLTCWVCRGLTVNPAKMPYDKLSSSSLRGCVTSARNHWTDPPFKNRCVFVLLKLLIFLLFVTASLLWADGKKRFQRFATTRLFKVLWAAARPSFSILINFLGQGVIFLYPLCPPHE